MESTLSDTKKELPVSSTGTVLVVDDELKNREVLGDLLEVNGHTVIRAEDGAQALESVAASPPDIILLDVMMPGVDGFEVCRKLKSDPKTMFIPIIMITALSDRDSRIKAIDLGANDFLSKPIDLKDVILRTRNAMISKKLYDQVMENYAELKKLEDIRDNLTHMIVHDLRSPLTGIMGFLQLLQMTSSSKLDSEEKTYVAKSLASSGTLLEMISSLLDVNRFDAGQMPLTKTESNLTEITNAAIAAVEGLTSEVALEYIKPEAPITLNCDSELTRRVIVNLLSNAIRFSPNGTSVKVTQEVQGDNCRVCVMDSGPGIPSEYREKIFNKFGQIETRNKAKYSTGLGLTFCKMAVEAHDGKIGVDSEVDKGSTFWFEMPI